MRIGPLYIGLMFIGLGVFGLFFSMRLPGRVRFFGGYVSEVLLGMLALSIILVLCGAILTRKGFGPFPTEFATKGLGTIASILAPH